MKIFKPLFLVICATFFINLANAMVEVKNDKNTLSKELKVTTFLDYPPFGEIKQKGNLNTFSSIFENFIKEYSQDNYFTTEYILNKDYNKLILDVRRGEIDLILGIYFETKQYKGLEIIYPAIINNPMTVIMLPARIGEVKSTVDLKKLKGGFNKNEHISDYASEQMKIYSVKEYDNSYKLFEDLFTGKIDYVFSGYYFGIVETSRLGLKNKISFSKQTLWDMPLFIGVSKTSRHRKLLFKTLSRMSEQPETKKKMNEALIEAINNIEKANIGVVPPAYTK